MFQENTIFNMKSNNLAYCLFTQVIQSSRLRESRNNFLFQNNIRSTWINHLQPFNIFQYSVKKCLMLWFHKTFPTKYLQVNRKLMGNIKRRNFMHRHDFFNNAFCSESDCVARKDKPERPREFTKELSSLKICLSHMITLIMSIYLLVSDKYKMLSCLDRKELATPESRQMLLDCRHCFLIFVQ